jgi:trk system potassium uptake protein TrkA
VFVIIAGGGRTATQLASMLLAQKHEVRLIEHRREILPQIHRALPTEVIYEGHATEPETLSAAEISRAQVVAACLPSDADNLALCFLARRRFAVPRTIACVNNPGNAWLFDERFHVDVALNQADILANLIEQELSLGDMLTLLKLRRGQYSVVGETIPAGAPAVGQSIQALPLPANCVIAAILRRGEVVIPRGSVRFEAGDEVLAVVDREAAGELAALFGHPERHAPAG